MKTLNKIINVNQFNNNNALSKLDIKLREIIMQEDINFLQEKYVKPITLKSLL